jgi:hypothetical protein
MANTETETRTGNCPTHGRVDATREIPRPGFPFIYHALKRRAAKRRPFQCPHCGAPVTTA